jgi:glycosyltransferase involved in cell wall biosynthesis
MRILYSHRIQSRDGQSVHVDELIAAFRAEGHEVMVVGPSFYDNASFGGESGFIDFMRKLLPGALGEVAELAYNIPAYRRLRAACREFKPDFIYERNNLYYLAGAWLARATGLPFLLEVNSPLADERIRFGNLRLHRLAHRTENQVWRRADRVLPVTGVLRDIIAATAGVPLARIVVVPNGVVLDRFAPAAERDGAAVTLGFVGFVRPWHGLDVVIREIAARKAGARINLTVVGDGPVRGELEAQAAALGVADRLTFLGVVAHAAVPGEVAKFDIALQPQVNAYASPLKIFDYMAAARAIVAPDQPNIREILVHEQTALLFDPTDPGALWQAVARLIDDPALRARLGANARAELERQDYTWRGNARRVAAMARAIAEEKETTP